MAKGNGRSRAVQELLLEKLDQLNERIGKMDDRLGMLREDLNLRLDKLIENTGAPWRDLERRVAAIEKQLVK